MELRVPDGRTLVAYDAGGDGPALLWHHGSPQTGALLPPLLEAAADRGIRLIGYARPGYGGSAPLPGRDVASAANDVASLADQLGVERFAVMGASGGGPHALACSALLGERVTGVACVAGIAPLTDAFDYWAGMAAPGALRAAADGREARAAFDDTFVPESFIDADWAALQGEWESLGGDAMKAGTEWHDGLVDDDVALAKPWGFELADVRAPVLLVQGGQDRVVPPAHAEWQLRRYERAELWLRPRDGHVSILLACPLAMDWLLACAR
jgi:pimeloyl-ACP methyl ester carboxylesterase